MADHVPVGQHLGSTDIEGTTRRLRQLHHGYEVVKDVSYRDRLASTIHPSGRHHQGLPLDEVAQNFERCGTRADDRTRPQNSDRCRARPERSLHLEARGQSCPRSFTGLCQPAEVKGPFTPGSRGSSRKRARELPVAICRGRILSQHRVRQVVGGPATAHLFSKPVGVSQITGDDLDPRLQRPAPVLQLLWTSSQTPYAIASLQKMWHQAATDVAGSSRHEDRLRGISSGISKCAHVTSVPRLIILPSRLKYFTVAEQGVLLNTEEPTRDSQATTNHPFSFTRE